MKKMFLIMLVLSMGFLTFSCTSTGYNTQKGAAIGTGLGALAGQIIGGNTAGTLIGAAVGALAGGIVGNAVDQDVTNQKIEAAQRSKAAYAAPQGSESKNPPGEWIEVPGQWIGGKWVPAHKAWVPVNP
ncbi:MAG: YMGG-like glycine zipper-containing protein [Proteobacteria bacterium]|nr:YMGG-like glycine zipper-containing protein [Pseudomonadota bacterium]